MVDDEFEVSLVEAVGEDGVAIGVGDVGVGTLGVRAADRPRRSGGRRVRPDAGRSRARAWRRRRRARAWRDGGSEHLAKHAVELGLGQEAGFGHGDQVVEKRVELDGEAARLNRAPGSQADQKMRPIPAFDKRAGLSAANSRRRRVAGDGRRRPWEAPRCDTKVSQRCGSAPHLGTFSLALQGLRMVWLGRQDSNLGMAESKSAALPLGYAPPGAKAGPAFAKRRDHSASPPPPQHLPATLGAGAARSAFDGRSPQPATDAARASRSTLAPQTSTPTRSPAAGR